MGYYTLTAPGVVTAAGRHRHYTSVPAQPIEVPDGEAAAQVQAGILAPYPPGREAAHRSILVEVAPPVEVATESDPPTAALTRRRDRRRKDDTAE